MKKQYWIIVSDPKEFDEKRFNSQSIIHWDVGLCATSNEILKLMKKNDIVLFMTSGDSLVSSDHSF